MKCDHSSDSRCINCDDSTHCYDATPPVAPKKLTLWQRIFYVPPPYLDTTTKPGL